MLGAPLPEILTATTPAAAKVEEIAKQRHAARYNKTEADAVGEHDRDDRAQGLIRDAAGKMAAQINARQGTANQVE